MSRWRIFFLACAVIFFPLAAGAADLFRWVDERGVIHFTDNPYNIPENLRATATRIKAREYPPDPNPPPPAPAAPDKASIPIQKKGPVVIVQGTLNAKTNANFVVDTGASYTMISQAVAKELRIDTSRNLPTVSFQTANGVINAPVVTLESIEVGGLLVKDLTAAVHDVFPDPTINGLLGLNFLSRFRMDIDTQNGLLILEKK